MADANAALNLKSVTIGILTALEEEYAACREVFDPNRLGAEHQCRATSGNFTCWLCQVTPRAGNGKHVVAITLLPDMGNNSAAIAANILLQHCPNTLYLIMCGIAGAVPNPDKPEDHVRLGDIVVSNATGIIQYDRGKQRDPRSLSPAKVASSSLDPLAGFEHRSPPRPPSPELLAAVQRMMADEHSLGQDDHREWETHIKEFFARCKDKEKWKRPAPSKDRLVDSPDGTGPSTPHPKDRARRKRIDGVKYPRVFRGSIGAANIVLGDPLRRDALRNRCSIKAVEMESSGVADAGWVAGVGYLVVRGTCDYCNTAKADGWHHYAALIAACFTKTVIEYLHAESHSTASEISPNASRVAVEAFEDGAARSMRGFEPFRGSCKLPPSYIDSADEQSSSLQRPQAQASLSVDFGTQQTINSPSEHILMLNGLVRSSAQDALTNLVSKIDDLLKEFLLDAAAPLAEDLEKRLRMEPKRGSIVRQGWMVLARLEIGRLQQAKQRGQAFDVARLRSLREEAENVID